MVWLLEQPFSRVGRFKIRARHLSRVGWCRVRGHSAASPRRAHGRVSRGHPTPPRWVGRATWAWPRPVAASRWPRTLLPNLTLPPLVSPRPCCHCRRVTPVLASARCIVLPPPWPNWVPSARDRARRRHAINGSAVRGPWLVRDARTHSLMLGHRSLSHNRSRPAKARTNRAHLSCPISLFLPLLSAAVKSWSR